MMRFAVVVAGLVSATAAYAGPLHHPVVADRIYFNGPIETLDAHMTRAVALAVADDRVLAVGGYVEVLRRLGPRTRFVNLHGHTLMPGFVDAHDHWFNEHDNVGYTLDEAQTQVIENGITSLADLFVNPPFLEEMQQFVSDGLLRVRTSLYLIYDNPCGQVNFGPWFLQYEPIHDPEAMLRIPGVKIFADPGIPGTCDLGPGISDAPAVTFTYTGDDPLVTGNGYLFLDQAQLDTAVATASNAGFQVAIHAIGDRARDEAILAIATALDGAPNLLRHRIEHNSIIRPDQIAMYNDIGIVPTVWTFNACAYAGHAGTASDTPDFVHPWLYPWRSMLASGSPLAWHSDFPYREASPVVNLWALVTGKQVAEDGSICEPPDFVASETLTVDQALRIMTTGSAYAIGTDAAVGSLERDKLADLIVLSEDPRTVAVDEIKDLQVLSTVIGGEALYCAAGHAQLCH